MRNPLVKRLPRELKSDFGKYLVIFLFLVMVIGLVSGFIVADGSLLKAYDDSFEKYNVEDGNFEYMEKADDSVISQLEKDGDVIIYSNFYIEGKTKEVDSTLRVFKNRTEVDKADLMKGDMPVSDSEIAIDRMYADNNKLEIGDTLTVDNIEYKISGLIALSDYSALFQNPSDMMFDAVKFGVALVTDDCFENMDDTHIHYSYSWKYNNPPEDPLGKEAKDMSSDFMKIAAQAGTLSNYIPRCTNQAINFTGDDMGGDKAMITAFLYIVVIIIAFIFAITTSNTITKESNVIGTLRASGYSKGEIIRHYLEMPLIVMLVAAAIGNILGYTFFKNFMADMYYGSYSLPTYKTIWSGEAFIKTTVVPLIIMFLINLIILVRVMSLSPLKFIRRDLKRRQKKKAFRLNTKIAIMTRFRIRIIFQNMSNYITIFIGVFFANFILLFGFMFNPILDNFKDDIIDNMIAQYQYILKSETETQTADAEKYAVVSLKTTGSFEEEITVYGVNDDSKYINASFNGDEVVISTAYAEKYRLKKGDTIKLKEEYGDKEYEFTISGTYDYPAMVTVFMSREAFNKEFDHEADYFNGYFSNTGIDDIDGHFIASEITKDDMTKTSRQLEVSMGNMVGIYLVFGVAMFMLIIYLLSKIIIEKNSQSISMAKILGYSNSEINKLYVHSTTFVVILSMILTIPLIQVIMGAVWTAIMSQYSGWLPFEMPVSVYIKIPIVGILSYAVIAFLQIRRVKRIPLGDALKNVE